MDDEVNLIAKPEKKIFAKAKIISVVEKPMGKLTDYDFEGHEKFTSKRQMYVTYSDYYNRKVRPTTSVMIIRFVIVAQY